MSALKLKSLEKVFGGNNRIVSSDLPRAVRTTEVIAAYFGIKQVSFDARLRELNYGDFEGKKYEVLKTSQPALFDEHGFFRTHTRIRGGESVSELRDRIASFIDEIVGDPEHNNIWIVAHGGSIKMLLSLCLNLSYNRIFAEVQLSDSEHIELQLSRQAHKRLKRRVKE